MKNYKFLFLLTSCFLGFSATWPVCAQLQEINDVDLRSQMGQGLLDMTTIVPGQNGAAAATSNDSGLTFYRMSLNGQLDMNVNINHMQLGCGGINDAINVKVCDIDINYLSLMGNNGSGGAGQPGSNFSMNKPYVTIAVNNSGNANRELVGIQIGAASATGFMSIGRPYNNGATNQEMGGSCSGGNDINCQTGLTSFSGYTGLVMTGTVQGSVLGGNFTSCLSQSTNANYCNNSSMGTGQRAVVSGTRVTDAYVLLNQIPTNACTPLLFCWFGSSADGSGINIKANIGFTENMRYIHGFGLNNLQNFFLSFQRQAVDWPNYDFTATGSSTDAAGTSWPNAYAHTANTGWWMNFPSDLQLAVNSTGQSMSAGQALGSLFGATVYMSNLNLGSAQTPAKNCFGSVQFC